ncbi:hypothetical protein Tco_1278853, partial [Tanacetum coccineum]
LNYGYRLHLGMMNVGRAMHEIIALAVCGSSFKSLQAKILRFFMQLELFATPPNASSPWNARPRSLVHNSPTHTAPLKEQHQTFGELLRLCEKHVTVRTLIPESSKDTLRSVQRVTSYDEVSPKSKNDMPLRDK